MPSNVTLNNGTGGPAAVTRQVTHDGDTAQLQGVFVMGISGSEDAYTAAAINGDATNGFDVDVTRVIPGTTATALGKAEDAAHSTGDTAVPVLAVRRDTAAVGSDTDGDYSTLNVDGSGRLWVNASGAAVPVTDNGGSLTVDNAALSVTGGGVEASALRVTIASDSTGVLSVDDNGGALTVDNAGTFAVQASLSAAIPAGTNNIGDVDVLSVVPGTGATALGKAEDAAHTTGDTGVLVLGVRRDSAAVGSDADGDYSTLNMDASGRVHVNVGNTVTVASHAVTNAGTFAVQVDGSALTALQLIDDPVFTDDAAFTPATSKVMMAGFQVDETSTDSVDEGDAGAARMSADRKQYTIAHQETSTIYQNGTARTPTFAIIDAATSGDNTLLAAQGVGNKIRVHALYLVSAGTVTVRFESGAGGTALSGQMNLVANTGFVLPFSPVGWFETAANTLLNLELSGAISVDGGFVYTVVT